MNSSICVGQAPAKQKTIIGAINTLLNYVTKKEY